MSKCAGVAEFRCIDDDRSHCPFVIDTNFRPTPTYKLMLLTTMPQ